MNGYDLVNGEALFIEQDTPIPDELVLSTPRVGVRGDQRAITAPWRFLIRATA